MVILTKRKFMFKSAIGDTFVSKGGMVIEEAPDWIQETRLFELAAGDGDLVTVQGNGSDKDADIALAKAKRTRAKKTDSTEKE